jgi:hypothetical protein
MSVASRKRQRQRRRYFPLERSAGKNWLIMGWTLVLVGVPVFLLAFSAYVNANPAKGWPVTEGVIESSEVGAVSTSSGRLGRGLSHFPDVRYRYTVGGKDFTGDKVHLGIGSALESDAKAVAARYRAGEKASIYYDPGNPAMAVLDPRVQGQTHAALWISGAGSAIGICCLLVFRSLRRKELG